MLLRSVVFFKKKNNFLVVFFSPAPPLVGSCSFPYLRLNVHFVWVTAFLVVYTRFASPFFELINFPVLWRIKQFEIAFSYKMDDIDLAMQHTLFAVSKRWLFIDIYTIRTLTLNTDNLSLSLSLFYSIEWLTGVCLVPNRFDCLRLFVSLQFTRSRLLLLLAFLPLPKLLFHLEIQIITIIIDRRHQIHCFSTQTSTHIQQRDEEKISKPFSEF